jgi:hypothetical protein
MAVNHSELTGSELHEPKNYILTVRLDDLDVADTVYVPIPYAGTVKKLVTTIDAALATSDETLTVSNSAAASMGTIVITQSGSAAGDVDTLSPSSNNTVTDDDYITIANDGASSTTVNAWVSITIERS